MKRLIGAVLTMGATVLGGAQVAQAGGATDAALGLAAFAVFNQFVRGETVFHGVFPPVAPVIIQQPVVVAAPPPVVVRPAPVVVVPAPPVVYALPPAVYYAASPPIRYRPAPVYYTPKRGPSAHHKWAQHKKAPRHWR
jgi:hypothetical protein